MDQIKIKIPDDLKPFIFTLSFIITMNIAFITTCNHFECYTLSLMNLFRTNIICNACHTISYQLQIYQMELYLAIGIYFTNLIKKKLTNIL